DRLALHLVDEVVLDAAAGYRAHHLAVVADHEHRAHRPRSRAPGVDHRAQGGAVAALGPLQSAAHHLEIDAVHRESFRSSELPKITDCLQTIIVDSLDPT